MEYSKSDLAREPSVLCALCGTAAPIVRARGASAPSLELPGLTQREMEILKLAAAGKTRAEMSSVLGTSVGTIDKQSASVCVKLKARNMVNAVYIACTFGLLS